MEQYAIITPTRDRPKMLEFCKYQVSKFTIQPEKHYIIDYPPVSTDVDISERVCLGVEMAKRDGIDLVFIVEDDDFYPFDYIERFRYLSDYQFFGSIRTTYYSLKNRTHQEFIHPSRSSLFTTGFRISAIDKFVWPKTANVDVVLWEYVFKYCKYDVGAIPKTGALGIKGHGIGKTGGNGHNKKFSVIDPGYTWLKQTVSKEAFEFYMSLI